MTHTSRQRSQIQRIARLQRRTRRSGFTLLEVLLVLAILGVIAAMVVPNLLGRQQEAYVKATRTSISGLEGAVKLYASEHDGQFPVGNQEAVFPKLMNPETDPDTGKQHAAYLEKLPMDAWKKPLRYLYEEGSFSRPKIWSVGPNGNDGDQDDITN